MTVASEVNRSGPYTGNGVTTVFAYGFRIVDEAHIQVVRTEANADTILALGTDYTVSGVGDEGGGSITTTVAPTAAQKITLLRNVPFTQETDLENQGAYFAETVEAEFDLSAMRDQQLKELLGRAVTLPASQSADDIPGFVSDIQNAAANAQLAINARDSALAAASALGNQVHQYDTRAMAIAATIPNGVNLVRLLGRAGAGDFGAGLHTKLGAAPGAVRSWHWQNVLSGAWWQLREFRVNPRMFGAVGDGVANDRAAVQDAIDFISTLLPGGVVEGIPGDRYRCVINSGVTDFGVIIKSGTTLDVNMSAIELECTGSVYGIRLQSNAHIRGPGKVKTTVSSASGSQGMWHAPISIGAAYGEVTSVGAIGNYLNATRWSVRGITIENVRAGGTGIAGMGGVSHGVIEDIDFPDNATLVGCINFDWGTVGAINSANVPASRVAYDAGTAYTVHPNNIYVRRINIGAMNYAGSTPIRLSGVHDIRVEGFAIAACKTYGVFHTAGDLGYEFAQDNSIRRRRHRGIVVRDGAIADAGNGGAIYCDAHADNIALAVASGYSPYLDATNSTNIVFDNIRSQGSISSAAGHGVVARYMEGGTFRNLFILGHQRGIVCAEAAKRILITGGEISTCYQEGIYIGAGTAPEEITVDGVWCYSNGTGVIAAGIRAQSGVRHTITRCRLGGVGESFQSYGVLVDPTAGDVEVSYNHAIGHKTPGAAFQIGTGASFGCTRLFVGNTYRVGFVGTPYNGDGIIIHSYRINVLGGVTKECLATRGTLSVDTTPTVGTWTAGDRIVFTNPVAGGKSGSICVNGGTPGTWKQFGAIDA